MARERPEKEKKIQLTLRVLVKKEGREYTALCTDLDIASCGPTVKSAVESVIGLVKLYVCDCVAQGEDPIPMRPVPEKDLFEFLSPPASRRELPVTSRRERVTIPCSYASA